MALTDKLTAVADAIRSKTGTTDPMTLDAMAAAVEGLEVGGGGGFPNGTKWTQSNLTGVTRPKCLFKNGLWVLGDATNAIGFYYSTDGKNWTQSNVTDVKVKSIHHAGGVWIISCDGSGVYRSVDGKTWSVTVSADGGYTDYTVLHGNGLCILMNDSFGDSSRYSTDGLTWIGCDIAYGVGLNVFDYGNGLWVGGYNSNVFGLYYSEDGMNWLESNIVEGNFKTIRYINGVWIALGMTNLSYYSKDGKTWTAIDNMSIPSFPDAIITEEDTGIILMAFTNMSSELRYSVDGITWNTSNLKHRSNDLKYANGIWVLGGSGAYETYYSSDGTTWTKCEGINDGVNSINNANGIWMIGATDGIYYSRDGKSWTKCETSTGESRMIYYANGIWTANIGSDMYYSVAWE